MPDILSQINGPLCSLILARKRLTMRIPFFALMLIAWVGIIADAGSILIGSTQLGQIAKADKPVQGNATDDNAVATQSARPNFLILFADDWGRFASAYAAIDPDPLLSLVRTPNIDRIAQRGVLFRHAFVSAPSCTPCRSALLSGQHFWRTGRGSILQGAVWDPTIPAFPLLLDQAGYHIGETFKVWSPGSPGDAPYGAGKFAYEKSGRKFNDFSENVTQAVREGSSVEAAKTELLDGVESNFKDFLKARPEGRPFCYWFGPTNTHRQWIEGSGESLWGFDPKQFQGKLPPFLPDVPTVRQDLADYFGEIAAWDAAVGRLLDELESQQLTESTMIIISGDHGPPGFPHGKCNLYGFGTEVSLMIAGPGIPNTPLQTSPQNSTQSSSQHSPDIAKPSYRVIDDLVSLTDIAPTILETAGLAVPQTMTGKSLLPMLQKNDSGKLDPNRDAVFLGRERHVENARADFTPYPQRAIRTDEFLYIINFRPDRWPLGDPYGLMDSTPPSYQQVRENTRATLPDEDAGPTKAWLVEHRNDPQWQPFFQHAYGRRPREELFDLRVDPHQMKNLAADPEYHSVRQGLEQRLLDELTRTGDPRMIDEGSFFETPPMSGPLTPVDAQDKPLRPNSPNKTNNPPRKSKSTETTREGVDRP
jgi:arylsulfatase A-like enzyme